jgi:hypothetical protein
VVFIDKTQIDETAATARIADYTAAHALDSTPQLPISLYENKDTLIMIITKLKQNPTLTLAQYNTYLSTLTWYQSATIRYFIYRMATVVAAVYGINITGMTETTVLQSFRDWVVATPAATLSKVILGTTTDL